jgi:hypothetical protein
MFDYAGAFVGICIVRPGDFVYIRLLMLVHLLGRPGEFVYLLSIMLVPLLGRPGEFVYIRLIMLVHLLGYALWDPANLFTYVYLCWCICWDMHCEARRICLHTFNYAGALVGEARRICLHTFNYAGAFVGICIVGPG